MRLQIEFSIYYLQKALVLKAFYALKPKPRIAVNIQVELKLEWKED